MRNTMLGAAAVALVLVLGGTGFYLLTAPADPQPPVTGFGSGITAVLYKSPTCGCCEGYAKALRRNGFTVSVRNTDDMDAVKKRYGIPQDGLSCHTVTMAGYRVEGHVPMEALQKLLTERPAIDGIGLARMPSGTPGMPGHKRAPFKVYQFTDGALRPYLTI